MMIPSGPLSRRTVLKGLGTAIALPWLEAMVPTLSAATAGLPKTTPTRMLYIYVPNGVHMPDWTPAQEGAAFELPATLKPLASFKNDLTVVSGLALDGARPHGDGGGDHARAVGSFLTSAHPRKTAGADIRTGVSVDQVAAQHLGVNTRFASLELGCEHGAQAGNCDSGYSCAYSSNVSWRTESTPMAKEVDPRQVFERLFTNGPAGEVGANLAKRERTRKSILDFVAEDARKLRTRLGLTDQRKVDEYLSSVREMEQRIDRAAQWAEKPLTPTMAMPAGIPKSYPDHIRLMADILVLAFQGDVTRISTFMFANAGSNRSYAHIGVPEGHHDLSHHGNDLAKQEKISAINLFHTTQLAYLLGKMKGVTEGNGTLLDNSMVVYGSGIGDGDRHNHDDLPILVAGHGRGTIKGGRHLKLKKETPMANLHLAILNRMAVPTKSFGDSTGALAGME